MPKKGAVMEANSCNHPIFLCKTSNHQSINQSMTLKDYYPVIFTARFQWENAFTFLDENEYHCVEKKGHFVKILQTLEESDQKKVE